MAFNDDNQFFNNINIYYNVTNIIDKINYDLGGSRCKNEYCSNDVKYKGDACGACHKRFYKMFYECCAQMKNGSIKTTEKIEQIIEVLNYLNISILQPEQRIVFKENLMIENIKDEHGVSPFGKYKSIFKFCKKFNIHTKEVRLQILKYLFKLKNVE